MTDFIDEWVNEGMDGWMIASKDWTESMIEWMNEWMNESINQWINESMNQWINESMNECTNKGTNSSFNEWVQRITQMNDKWMKEQVTKEWQVIFLSHFPENL